MTWRPMKIKKIFIGRRPARETPRNQGGGRAKRHSCEALNDANGGKMGHALKFGGLAYTPLLRQNQKVMVGSAPTNHQFVGKNQPVLICEYSTEEPA